MRVFNNSASNLQNNMFRALLADFTGKYEYEPTGVWMGINNPTGTIIMTTNAWIEQIMDNLGRFSQNPFGHKLI